VRVGADGVDVKEIRHTEFAEAEFETAPREFVEEGEESALVLDFVLAEGEDFVNHGATEVGRFAQQGVADDIEVGVAG